VHVGLLMVGLLSRLLTAAMNATIFVQYLMDDGRHR